VNGIISFNGTGGVNLGATQLTFSIADDAGAFDNIICQPTLAGGSYSVNADGTGTMHLGFDQSNQHCFGDAPGSMDFFLAVGKFGKAPNQFILSDFNGLTLLDIDEEIESITLQGSLTRQ